MLSLANDAKMSAWVEHFFFFLFFVAKSSVMRFGEQQVCVCDEDVVDLQCDQ